MDRFLVNLDTLPEEGLSVNETLSSRILELQETNIKACSDISLNFHVQRFDDDIIIQGKIEVLIEFECVRTLHPFTQTIFVESCDISLPAGSKRELDASEAVREEIVILFPGYPKCEDGDEEMSCSIDSRYLAVDKPAEDRVDVSPPIEDKDDRWSALDDITSSD